ncbi:U2 small nuclear ribonucleoprotein auxiliary factor 35 kDa subunit-related protein 1 [Colletes gigas]|uniref:U2 small nuclear ribonucleoprotein auxiliary factor 35 kDa subunit-related protein 1 n=1 Tax=Colletes gigas TaxID=935657 RepID=UPI001C9A339B|nr:U2 small nuclear ribonucleoprotein auxiliary factor 35 kDa subunit-related protein 1 [Colletes gigas]XP_043248308.1 U2 small nuclear ribonucleoprotein auxiliary factor 35 kDa subunit-related protein 1 [Colletes gigas]
MEGCCPTKRSHKEWRRTVKKERRRRLRRKAAAEREADAERLAAALERSADYLNWIKEREVAETEKEQKEKEEHIEREKLWLEEEVKAQKEWQILQERKQKARQQQLEQEMKIRQEFEAKQEAIRKKQEEEKRKREEDIRKREQLLKEIDDYIDNGIKTPEALREVINSQPGKELCPFFTKTGACRYGDTCSRNHRRVCLSKVILVPGFYTHFSLEKNSAEYDTDVALEFESSETRQHFREFYKDVVPELESFGRIKTLKYCCNTEVHLRGNLYVEYYTEREAARAMRKLKGRWYAGRQLNCEFANLKSWRSAVCGMSKCPKGRACNFLHTFKNPHDEYDIKSPPRWAKQSASSSQEVTSSRRSEHRSKSKWEEGSDTEDGKNWRWSESPEPEPQRTRNTEKRHRRSDENIEYRQKSTRDKAHDQSAKGKLTENVDTPVKRRRSSSRKHFEDENKDDDVSNGREYSRKYSKKYQRRRETEDDYDESKSSRHSSRRYSKTDDKSYRSKSHKLSNKYSGREKDGREKIKQKSRNRRDLSEDSSRKKRKKNSDTFDTEETDDTKDPPRLKSKWDKENSEQISSNGTESSDTDSSSATEDKKTERSRRSKKNSAEHSDYEWATTDSENEHKIKEK